jgi:hypothetical protein
MEHSPYILPHLVVSDMHLITLPKDATIDALKKDLPLFTGCNEALTDSAFCCKSSKGKIQGGFLFIGKKIKNYESRDGVDAVCDFAKHHNRKLRLGTPLEFIAYIKANLPHPDFAVSLAKVDETGHVLVWQMWPKGKMLGLVQWAGRWDKAYRIFVVEDL